MWMREPETRRGGSGADNSIGTATLSAQHWEAAAAGRGGRWRSELGRCCWARECPPAGQGAWLAVGGGVLMAGTQTDGGGQCARRAVGVVGNGGRPGVVRGAMSAADAGAVDVRGLASRQAVARRYRLRQRWRRWGAAGAHLVGHTTGGTGKRRPRGGASGDGGGEPRPARACWDARWLAVVWCRSVRQDRRPERRVASGERRAKRVTR